MIDFDSAKIESSIAIVESDLDEMLKVVGFLMEESRLERVVALGKILRMLEPQRATALAAAAINRLLEQKEQKS